MSQRFVVSAIVSHYLHSYCVMLRDRRVLNRSKESLTENCQFWQSCFRVTPMIIVNEI